MYMYCIRVSSMYTHACMDAHTYTQHNVVHVAMFTRARTCNHPISIDRNLVAKQLKKSTYCCIKVLLLCCS